MVDASTPLMGSQSNSRRPSRASLSKQPSYKQKSQQVDDANGDGESNTSADKVFKMLGQLMMVLTFTPIFLGMLIEDMRIASTAAMATAIFNIVLSFILFKLGRTVSWPKPLDVILFVLFFIQTVSVWVWRESNDFWRMWSGVVLSFGQAAGVAFFWFVLGQPFTRTFVEDEFGKIGATFPFVQLGVRITSAVWLIAFILMGVLALPAGIAQSRGDPSEQALRVGMIGGPIVGFGAYALSFPVLNWFMDKYEDAIFEKYEEEIKEWMEKYPDEKFTIMTKEGMAQAA